MAYTNRCAKSRMLRRTETKPLTDLHKTSWYQEVQLKIKNPRSFWQNKFYKNGQLGLHPCRFILQ